MKKHGRKVLKLGITEECLGKMVAIHRRMGTDTLTEAVMRMVDECEEQYLQELCNTANKLDKNDRSY